MIRFFISSTFKDMVEEREAIHRIVLPELRSYGMERGVNIDICDLRWGISFDRDWDEAKSIAEIMKVCFREVRDCKPHIVAILGDHYGSEPPDSDLIRRQWVEMGRREVDIPSGDISLTQWELEYAFLSKNSLNSKALCLFRKGNEKEREQRMDDLRHRILRKSKARSGEIRCEDFDTIDDFVERFIEYGKTVIDEEAKQYSQKNWVERELAYSRAYSQDRSREFAGRDRFIRTFRSFMQDGKARVLGFYGPSGIGKSSLMARLYQMTIRSGSRWDGEIIACGVSQNNSRYLNILLEIIYIFESRLLNENAEVRDKIYREDKAEEYLENVLALYQRKKPHEEIAIFVDAMDKLSVERTNDLIQIFVQTDAPNIKFICSQIQPYENKIAGFQSQKVTDLTEKEIRQILIRKLYAIGQEPAAGTSNRVIAAIMNKEDSSSPLYINIVRNILKIHMAEGQSIREKDDSLLNRIEGLPEKLPDICRIAIAESINYVVGEKDDDDNGSIDNMMMEAMSMIAASRHGLREQDLEKIFADDGWRSALFSGVKRYLSDFLRQQDNGCWAFEHDIIRRSLLEITEAESKVFVENTNIILPAVQDVRRRLIDFVIDEEDYEVRVREGLYLSYLFNNGYLALNILTEICNKSMVLRRMAAKEMQGILKEPGGNAWLRLMIRSDIGRLLRSLGGLLEQRYTEDFERRIPAKELADAFLRETGLMYDRRIRQWMHQDDRMFSEKYAMAFFCAEYAFVCESIGEMKNGFEFLFMPVEFFRERETLEELDDEEKKKAYTHINGLLYCSNLLINQLINLSKGLISWNEKDHWEPWEEGMKSPEREALFQGNTAQFYTAVNDLQAGLPYRIQTLYYRMKNLCNVVENENRLSYDKFLQISHISEKEIASNGFDQNTIVDININDHLPFIDGIAKAILNKDYEKDEQIAIVDLWKRTGVAYRNIAYHIGRLSEEHEVSDDLIVAACRCADISLHMMSVEFMDDERERLGSIQRRIQIYLRDPGLNRSKAKEIVAWCADAVELYRKNEAYFGTDTGRTLKKALNDSQEALKKFRGLPQQLAAINDALT